MASFMASKASARSSGRSGRFSKGRTNSTGFSLPASLPLGGRDADSENPVELVRPFENLPDLPDDLAEAFDAMKLAILHHKTDGWEAIAAADVLHALDALKALVTAPSDEAPF